jgi:protein-S-isoprenylcysteine O-methyltransferase Ste14
MKLLERLIMKNIKFLPPTYLLIAIILMGLLQMLFPITVVFATPWNLVGILFLFMGIMIDIDANKAFRVTGTTVKPFVESTSLVTGGIYRFSRNPMYFGFVLVLIGLGILLGSLAPFLIVVLFTILINREFITVEEQMLAKKFRREWSEYKAKVRRWL